MCVFFLQITVTPNSTTVSPRTFYFTYNRPIYGLTSFDLRQWVEIHTLDVWAHEPVITMIPVPYEVFRSDWGYGGVCLPSPCRNLGICNPVDGSCDCTGLYIIKRSFN